MISAFSANSAMVCLPVRCPILLIDRTISRSIGSRRISLLPFDGTPVDLDASDVDVAAGTVTAAGHQIGKPD